MPEWFKISLLGEGETVARLNIKSWWGLAQLTPFWVRSFFLTVSISPIGFISLENPNQYTNTPCKPPLFFFNLKVSVAKLWGQMGHT